MLLCILSCSNREKSHFKSYFVPVTIRPSLLAILAIEDPHFKKYIHTEVHQTDERVAIKTAGIPIHIGVITKCSSKPAESLLFYANHYPKSSISSFFKGEPIQKIIPQQSDVTCQSGCFAPTTSPPTCSCNSSSTG